MPVYTALSFKYKIPKYPLPPTAHALRWNASPCGLALPFPPLHPRGLCSIVFFFLLTHLNSLTIKTLIPLLCASRATCRQAWQTVTKLHSIEDAEVKGFTLRLDTRQKAFLSKMNGWSKQ